MTCLMLAQVCGDRGSECWPCHPTLKFVWEWMSHPAWLALTLPASCPAGKAVGRERDYLGLYSYTIIIIMQLLTVSMGSSRGPAPQCSWPLYIHLFYVQVAI